MTTLNSCIFCKIIAKEIPTTLLAETDQLIVIKDIHPKAPIHYLIIPKKHIKDITDLNDDENALAGALILMAKQLAHKLEDPKAFRLIVNNGADAGQCVFHMHFHFLSGKKMFDF